MKNTHMNSEMKAMHIDMSHVEVLDARTHKYAVREAEDFLTRIRHHVDTAYLHLDVQPQKEQTRSVPAYRWRALLITNRGRYYADDWSFGAVESLKNVLDKVEQQITHRLGKLEEQYKELFA